MKIWHPSQKLTHRKDGSVILEMTVADLDEVAAWVLTFGPAAVVHQPRALRAAVAEAAAATATRYQEEP